LRRVPEWLELVTTQINRSTGAFASEANQSDCVRVTA
jgi:hypothetical protein